MSKEEVQKANLWQALQEYTNARIAIGRTGSSIPVKESLGFKLAHAHARDAVYSKLDTETLTNELKQFGKPVLHLHSKAGYREQYLQRPDMGRLLNSASINELKEHEQDFDIVIVIADGLSAEAVNANAIKLLQLLVPMLLEARFKIAPFCLVKEGRVAIADDIGGALNANISLILIGERPGLSAADSMGAYLTYNPKRGLTDEARNCVSNIRPEGLPHQPAAQKLFYLIRQAFLRRLSGVQLKDDDQDGRYFP